MLKGVIHIHSTYSDGDFSLAELRETFLSAGCTFALVTDHAESFDHDKLESYRHDCASLSDERFRFVPGLEYECEQRLHVLGYGVASLVTTKDPEEVIRHIAAEQGISVIAHPSDDSFSWIETFRTLPDGIEVWNSKYDGRYALRPGTVRLLQRLQQRKPDLRAFYGQDLHWKKQYRGLYTIVSCRAPSQDSVLWALAQGEFFACKGALELPSSGQVPEQLLNRFEVIQGRFRLLREAVSGGKALMKRFGLSVPAPIKAQLRRIF
jgi:hypothetical protein